jgi:FKBP-type peptidyl-prolyl cis-trans isomerase
MTISMVRAALLGGLVCLAGPACAQAPAAAPTDYAAAQTAWLDTLAPAQGWRATASGIRYRRVHGNGAGAHPTVADIVRLRYSVKFTDGRELENSGDDPVDLPLGRLIPGWQEGVPLMGVGDRYEFAIPAALAYGPNDNGPIPGGSTLLFTIDLVAINPTG